MAESARSPKSTYLQAEATSQVEFFEAEEILTVVQKFDNLPLSEMGGAFDSTFGALFPFLAAQGITPTGPAFSLHHEMPRENATFEVGIPVNQPLREAIITESGATLESSTLPTGRIARVSSIGSYDNLGESWGAFMKAIGDAGEHPELPFWEVYVTEPAPETDPDTLRTDLYCPVSH
ncbi:GyrI-like domain-containing protein [Corynebacterium sp. A21]|uniref:GyrI-like domain-containing protein n=1 Tax=Corynebacterium sp. A21 TaxID=3457318 RepID=UPI003FD5B693